MKNILILVLFSLVLIGCGGGGGGGTPPAKDPLSITTSGYTLSGTVPTVATGVPIEILVDGTPIDDSTGSTWTATVAGPGTYTVTLRVNSSDEVVKTVIITEN